MVGGGGGGGGGGWGGGGATGAYTGEEMTQTLQAHMNKKKKRWGLVGSLPVTGDMPLKRILEPWSLSFATSHEVNRPLPPCAPTMLGHHRPKAKEPKL
jgi:hypothetical protein